MKYDSDILMQIQAIERKQLRSMAELLADPHNQEARRNFDLRKSEIDRLRQMLSTSLARGGIDVT
jgi:hypothetical protein